LPFHIIEKKEAKYKKSDRISKGSEKWLDLKKWQDTSQCLSALKKQGYRICVTTLEGAEPLEAQPFDGPTAFVLGNEKDGVTEEAIAMADVRVAIPMKGFTQSFNISVAAALGFYQIYQKRVAMKGVSGDLTREEIDQVTANYYLRSLDSAANIIEHALKAKS
jgi:tRNA (guanosine-2'-O-)-methyltransferase